VKANEQRIAHGEWPQFFVGAFPNYFVLPRDPETGSGYVAGQAPGTHWYHAHKHGSTAINVAGLKRVHETLQKIGDIPANQAFDLNAFTDLSYYQQSRDPVVTGSVPVTGSILAR
jgi:hypothetical protein